MHPIDAPGIAPRLQRSRSVGPVSRWYAQYDPTYDVEQHALTQILPNFAAQGFDPQNGYSSDWIRANPEIGQNVWNALLEEELRKAWYMTLNTVAMARAPDIVSIFSQRLLDELNACFRDDLRSSVWRGGFPVSRRSQHLFRCFAEISREGHSRPIGNVLQAFFVDHVRHLAVSESARALTQWCFSICRAAMSRDDKDSCLSKLLRCRPALIDEVKMEGGPRARQVADALAELAFGSGFSSRDLTSPFVIRPSRYNDDTNDHLIRGSLDPNDMRYIHQCQERAEYHLNAAARANEQVSQLQNAERQSTLGLNVSRGRLSWVAGGPRARRRSSGSLVGRSSFGNWQRGGMPSDDWND